MNPPDAMTAMKRQIRRWSTAMTDEEARAVADAVLNGHLSMGALTRQLEERLARLLNVKHALMTTSGTMALALAYWSVGLKSGDEILVPDCTFIATANAAAIRGVAVRLIDITPDSFTFDAAQIEKNLTPRTRAIAVVHLNGRPADMVRIREIADRHRLSVIEDACQAFCCAWRGTALGAWGDVGCYSLGVTKLITTGQGGVVVTNNGDIYEQALRYRDHYRVGESERAFRDIGVNLKYPDILAAMGLVQLEKLSQHRKSCIEQYRYFQNRLAAAPGIRLHDYGGDDTFPLWNEIWIGRRAEFIAFMKDRGIDAWPVHSPLHRSTPYASDESFPCSDRYAAGAVYLPSGPAQRQEDLAYTADACIEFAEAFPR